MKTAELLFVLTLVVFTSANPRPGQTVEEQSDASDADLARSIIECARKAMVTGIPEIRLPSYNPYAINQMEGHFFTTILGLMGGGYATYNPVIEGIPFWEVTQFDELSSDNGVDVFNYTIYWEKIVIKFNWDYYLRILGLETKNEGAAIVELDDVRISGTFSFTKPGSGRTETIDDLEINIAAQGGKLDFTNLGALSDKIHESSDVIISYVLNHLDISELSEDFKNKLMHDWIQRPDRIDVIMARCQE